MRTFNAGSDVTAGMVQTMNNGDAMAGQYLANPVLGPKQLVLSGNIATGSTRTYFYFADALGLATDLSLAVDGGTNGIAMSPAAGVGSSTAIQRFLQSYAIVCRSFNFNTTDSTLVENSLKAIYANIDGDFGSKSLFVSGYVSAVANNPNLLNVNIPFVWTFNTILKVPVTAPAADSTTFTYTFRNLSAVPYGMLSEWLKTAKIVDVASQV